MGNVYASSECTDRTYGRGGQLRQDGTWHYHYDAQGNLVLKTKRRIDPSCGFESVLWHKGDYAYVWQANGMLRSVTRPDGKTVTFKYDALGRRKEKRFDGRIHRYLWDGNVVLHEWAYAETDSPQEIITEDGRITFDRSEPADDVITWVYDTDNYVPTAKIENGKTYSIVSDYIGRPVQAYDECGTVVWQADYDIYGNLRNLRGDREFIPFRQLGQYEDAETGLYYNRFRYYNPNIGNYISQDPIGLEGGMVLYGYVYDSNVWIDPLGLSGIIYLRIDPYTGKQYVGKSKSPEAFMRRQAAHNSTLKKVNPDGGEKYRFEKLQTDIKGKTDLSLAEENWIREKGGIAKDGGPLENKIHAMSDENYQNAGGTKDKVKTGYK